jgi:hypothetical protein
MGTRRYYSTDSFTLPALIGTPSGPKLFSQKIGAPRHRFAPTVEKWVDAAGQQISTASDALKCCCFGR